VRDETGAIRRFVNVYVGDDECRTLDGLGTTVRPGTVVYVIPSVAGG
jgi:molybdopterin converting factor small subunit